MVETCSAGATSVPLFRGSSAWTASVDGDQPVDLVCGIEGLLSGLLPFILS